MSAKTGERRNHIKRGQVTVCKKASSSRRGNTSIKSKKPQNFQNLEKQPQIISRKLIFYQRVAFLKLLDLGQEGKKKERKAEKKDLGSATEWDSGWKRGRRKWLQQETPCAPLLSELL